MFCFVLVVLVSKSQSYLITILTGLYRHYKGKAGVYIYIRCNIRKGFSWLLSVYLIIKWLDVFLYDTRGEQHMGKTRLRTANIRVSLQENRCSWVTWALLASDSIVLFPVMLSDPVKIAFWSHQSPGKYDRRELFAMWQKTRHTKDIYLWFLLLLPPNRVVLDFFAGQCSIWHKYNRLTCRKEKKNLKKESVCSNPTGHKLYI